MLACKALLGLSLATVATAHFGLEFPSWRADTLSEEGEALYSQYTYPCAGVDYGVGNITDWPLTGGAVKLDLHHPWSYVFINIGLGANSTNFNVSLTPQFLNATGSGQLCLDSLPLDADIANGTLGSIQVVTVGDSGTALYNCADVRFVADAEGPSNCTSEMDVVTVRDQSSNTTEDDSGSSSSNSSDSSSGGGSSEDSAAGFLSVNKATLASIVGIAALVVLGQEL